MMGSVEPETAEKTERLLAPAEAASRLGVVTRTLANWHRDGKITARLTLGGRRRYPEHEVNALAARRAEAVA
jgi:excisionase family DNA binding protein